MHVQSALAPCPTIACTMYVYVCAGTGISNISFGAPIQECPMHIAYEKSIDLKQVSHVFYLYLVRRRGTLRIGAYQVAGG